MAGAHLAGGAVAGGDQDLGRGDTLLAVDQQQGVFVLEHGAVLHNRDAGLFDIGLVETFQPVNLAVLVGDQRGPVELALPEGPAIAGRVHDVFLELAGIDQELLGNAAADDAGAAQAVFLGQRHARTGQRRHAAGAHAARAAANDEKVVVELRHGMGPGLAL